MQSKQRWATCTTRPKYQIVQIGDRRSQPKQQKGVIATKYQTRRPLYIQLTVISQEFRFIRAVRPFTAESFKTEYDSVKIRKRNFKICRRISLSLEHVAIPCVIW